MQPRARKQGVAADVFRFGGPQGSATQSGNGSADGAHTGLVLAGQTFTFSPGP